MITTQPAAQEAHTNSVCYALPPIDGARASAGDNEHASRAQKQRRCQNLRGVPQISHASA